MVLNILQAAKIHPDHQQFHPGDTFIAIISSVESSDTFYVVPDGTTLSFDTENLYEMFWIPQMYETFFLRTTDGNFFRATRVPVEENLDQMVDMSVLLIDTGEIFTMNMLEVPGGTFFEMKEDAKKAPGSAIRCEVHEVNVEHDFGSDDEFLNKNIYRSFKFEVIQVGTDGILVTISSAEEDSGESNEDEGQVEVPQQEIQVDLTPITKASMNPEQLEMFFQDTPSTENPQIAFQGFQTKDDDRLCKFYDPEIGGCWKGGRCKLRHRLEMKDGTCRDQREVFFDIAKMYPLPKLHSVLKVEITSFRDVSRFICRYKKVESKLPALMQHMNSPDEVKNYKKIPEIPAIGQLVIAKVGETFHRARVDDSSDLDDVLPLLLLDQGVVKRVEIKNIFCWERQFDYLSFQSVEMEIANVKPLPGNAGYEEGARLILEIQKTRGYLKAVVFQNAVGIHCKLQNGDMEDLGEELVSRGLAELKNVVPPVKMESGTFLPG